jgi:hypothetical protein
MHPLLVHISCSIGMPYTAEYSCSFSVAFERPNKNTVTCTFPFPFTATHVLCLGAAVLLHDGGTGGHWWRQLGGPLRRQGNLWVRRRRRGQRVEHDGGPVDPASGQGVRVLVPSMGVLELACAFRVCACVCVCVCVVELACAFHVYLQDSW